MAFRLSIATPDQLEPHAEAHIRLDELNISRRARTAELVFRAWHSEAEYDAGLEPLNWRRSIIVREEDFVGSFTSASLKDKDPYAVAYLYAQATDEYFADAVRA